MKRQNAGAQSGGLDALMEYSSFEVAGRIGVSDALVRA